MDVVTGVAQGIAALAGVGKIVSVRSRADRLRSKIENHIVLLDKLPAESASKQLLVGHIDQLMSQMVREESDAVSSKLQWNSISLAALGAGGFGVWAWVASPPWLQIPLWVVAGLFAMSLFGLVTTPKKQSEPNEVQTDEADLRRQSGKDLRAASGSAPQGIS